MSAEYDAVTCITAGELRAAGMPVPASIPDCGWVRRSAMKLHPTHATKSEGETTIRNGRCHIDRSFRVLPIITTSIEFTEPFRWLEVKGTLEC